MRISKFKIPKTYSDDVKLKEINLSNKELGSVVALVGKNGAGKTRILNYVKEYFDDYDSDSYFEKTVSFIPDNLIRGFQSNINAAEREYRDLIENNDQNALAENKKRLNDLLSGFIIELKSISSFHIKEIDVDQLKKLSTNSPYSIENLLNKNNDKFVSLNEFTILNSQSTIDFLIKTTTSILKEQFNLYLKNQDNPTIVNEELKVNQHFQFFEKLKYYIKIFLNKELGYLNDKDSNVISSYLTFNNENFIFEDLSPGQRILFAYALFFFYIDLKSAHNISESIIVIDEPEKHLHPEAQIQLIKALKEIIKEKGQLWIATHSVHILSHLNYDEIFLVKDDELIPPSRIVPGKSLNDLMGLEEHFFELKSFLNSQSEWAFGNFIAQCFNDPDEVFSINKNDPQYLLFKGFITNNMNTLDYGAGQGRIGYTILEDEKVSSKIRYNAYTLESNENLTRLSNLENLFLSLNEIPESTFDAVILCNVLHEIHPNEWIENILKIRESLNDDGYLLFIEDRILPKGEKIDEFGYLILGNDEVSILMNSNNPIVLKSKDKEYKERLIFSAFKKDQINCTEESLVKSITKLKENAWKNIKTLRKDEENLKQGRKLANETQLYINSSLFLESVTKTKKQ